MGRGGGVNEGEKEGRRKEFGTPNLHHRSTPLRLFIVTVALSVTIRPQFAIECLRRSNQQELGDFDFAPKFKGVPLGADPSCWGCKERTSQAN